MKINMQLFGEEASAVVPVEGAEEEKPKVLTMEERMAKLEAMLGAMTKAPERDPNYAEKLKAKEEELRQANAKAILANLRQQEAEARELYPKLSLKEEVKNPQFLELLKCGIDVRSAFEVIHKDEIITASMEYAAREVERLMTNKLLSEGKRPAENGGHHGPALTKTDVRSMTRGERKDIIRRVRMGEKISF